MGFLALSMSVLSTCAPRIDTLGELWTPKAPSSFDAGIMNLPGARLYDRHILDAAAYYRMPPALIKAVVAAESAFRADAQSPVGAMGLMQLMPSTARELRVKDVLDPRSNIFGGTRYLRLMANRFKGDIVLSLAAYNAGPEAVRRVGYRVPRIPETQNYVTKVLKYYNHFLCNLDHRIASEDDTKGGEGVTP